MTIPRSTNVDTCKWRVVTCPAWYGLKIRVGDHFFFHSFQCRNSPSVFLPLPISQTTFVPHRNRFAIQPEPIQFQSSARPSSVIVASNEPNKFPFLLVMTPSLWKRGISFATLPPCRYIFSMWLRFPLACCLCLCVV